jgi:hypothetical protein
LATVRTTANTAPVAAAGVERMVVLMDPPRVEMWRRR